MESEHATKLKEYPTDQHEVMRFAYMQQLEACTDNDMDIMFMIMMVNYLRSQYRNMLVPIVIMEEAILRKADQAQEEFNSPHSSQNYWTLRRLRSDAAQFSARVEEIRRLPDEGYMMRIQPMTQRETLINEAGHTCLQMTLCRILRGERLYYQWSNYLGSAGY